MQPVGPRRSKFIQRIHVAPNSLMGPFKRHLTFLPFVHLSLGPFAWSPLGHVVRNTPATPPLRSRLDGMLKFNKHCITFVLFDKKFLILD
jgi:hypothetical protein